MTCTTLDQLIEKLSADLLRKQKNLKAYLTAIAEKDYSVLPEHHLRESMLITRGIVTGINKSLQAVQTLKRESEPQYQEFCELEGVKLTINPGWSDE